MYAFFSFLFGILFGLGLVISNMSNPAKVLNFLDVTGYWDPSLMLVMIAAVATTCIGFYFIKKRKKPLLENKFHYPSTTKIEKKLIVGSALFGVGWGITGYCPGPSFAALGTTPFEVIYYIVGMILGSLTYYGISKR
jgi:uncharacterized membrane protein YedE/YeeE